MPAEETLWDKLGGQAGAERLVGAFVDRVMADPIIGFRFAGVPRDPLVAREIEHLSRILGGPHAYQGRPLAGVHRPQKINRGQFRRRLALIRKVGADLGVDPEILDAWVAHDAKMEPVITDGTDCIG